MESHPQRQTQRQTDFEEKSSKYSFSLQGKNPRLWELYKKASENFWTTSHVSLKNDKRDFDTLSKQEQKFIKMVLAFFAPADGIVSDNIATRFLLDVEDQESKFFYALQAAVENIHSEMYALMIDAYVTDPEEKNKLLDSINNFPAIRKKAPWAYDNTCDSKHHIGRRMVANAIVEGVFFSGSFCAIFWFKKKGKLEGL